MALHSMSVTCDISKTVFDTLEGILTQMLTKP